MERKQILEKAIYELERVPLSILLTADSLEYWFSLREIHGLTWKFINNKREGLYLSQDIRQFSEYLSFIIHVVRGRIYNYLEIGVFNAGTWVVTTEALRKVGLKKSIGFDIKCSKMADMFAQMPYTSFYEGDSRGSLLDDILKTEKIIDLVLIDGDHTYEGCKNDFEKAKDCSNVIVFHDIAGDAFPGVRRVWNEVKKQYCNDYFFTVFYSLSEYAKRPCLGIGVARRIKWLTRKE